ncbi:hypothetical protein EVAR_23407_1 [Eumeta japonica]|uniref:Uncharacterized protein n=1 Tax=Eumeta variegata TaxID=151549 RepID=A0A4C1VX23_EUMVA|nr:hypothetical protein EVAR_23407_1 [Eumeta japonica]
MRSRPLQKQETRDSSEKNYGTSVEIASYTTPHTSSPRHSIICEPLRLQDATVRRDVRRPSKQSSATAGYLTATRACALRRARRWQPARKQLKQLKKPIRH